MAIKLYGIYKCIESFEIEVYDDEGRSTDEYMEILVDSKFELTNINQFEPYVMLQSKTQWLDIPVEILDEYFELVPISVFDKMVEKLANGEFELPEKLDTTSEEFNVKYNEYQNKVNKK
jgi:hypothetical protein